MVVGSGPNGLAAAITIAQAGRSVLVLEAEAEIGGGTRSEPLTLPGYVHDVCSAIHPLAHASPFFRSLPLAKFGLEWSYPPVELAHPLDDAPPVLLHRSVEKTAGGLGRDAHAYQSLFGPLVRNWDHIITEFLAPAHLFRHPIAVSRFGLHAVRSASGLARGKFREARTRGYFAGLAAHSVLPLTSRMTASFGLMLGITGHGVGWPIARGGSGMIARAMSECLKSLGGEIRCNRRVESLDEIPKARAVLFDVTPRQLLNIAGKHFPSSYASKLKRYRYGPGVFKIDYALDGPIPWKAPECRLAGTVHLGPSLEEIERSEQDVWDGAVPKVPYVLVAQQSLFDPRAPDGKHTGWAYCHVPNGEPSDASAFIEAQIERFAPGFASRILERHAMNPAAFEQHNQNYVGGDISGGSNDLSQLPMRPFPTLDPYSTPAEGIYMCSSSTPPGGGVHGMCGYFAAKRALKRLGRKARPQSERMSATVNGRE